MVICWTSVGIAALFCLGIQLLIQTLFRRLSYSSCTQEPQQSKTPAMSATKTDCATETTEQLLYDQQTEVPLKNDFKAPLFTIGPSALEDDAIVPVTQNKDAECQANLVDDLLPPLRSSLPSASCRSLSELSSLVVDPIQVSNMSDQELVTLMIARKIKSSQLEKLLGNEKRAVRVRRLWLSKVTGCEQTFASLPYSHYDYSFVSNSCCENVIGYIPIPVGYAGPLQVNGRQIYVPMATTEGCLVASTNRGCRAISDGEGVSAFVYNDGMSRGPAVRFETVKQAVDFKRWVEKPSNFQLLKQKFDSTSRYAKLKSIKCSPAGRVLYLRFVATTGDAMGMNMVSKGTEAVLQLLTQQYFLEMQVISLSGNACVDKKPAAINWIEGRGKSVISEATIPASTVSSCLKSDVDSLVELNCAKNLVGSAMSGVMGGFNAHSANIVTAIFLATGQDAAQNISSSSCLTQIEKTKDGDLYICCTMPSLEVGTVGGGTILPPQRSCLELLGCAGSSTNCPGSNASQLAETICAAVLAGELSLLAALTSGDLVRSHIRYNRSTINLLSASSSSMSAARSDSSPLREVVNRSAKAYLNPNSCSQAFS